MKRVLITRRLFAQIVDSLADIAQVDYHDEDALLPRAELLRRVADRQGLMAVLTDRIDAELLDSAPQLKVVSNVAVGFNNIDVAACTARGVMVTNTPGVLDEEGKLLTGITPRQIDDMVAGGTLSGGMLPKISSALDAARNGVKSVHIIDGRVEHALLLEILTDHGVGTMIKSH